jgi:PadR family transcriptional regulator PadR
MALKQTAVAGEVLQGTLDMLILRTLLMGRAHGHTIAQVIEHTSENALEIEQGSLYPALHRLEDRRLLASDWDLAKTIARQSFIGLLPRSENVS